MILRETQGRARGKSATLRPQVEAGCWDSYGGSGGHAPPENWPHSDARDPSVLYPSVGESHLRCGLAGAGCCLASQAGGSQWDGNHLTDKG